MQMLSLQLLEQYHENHLKVRDLTIALGKEQKLVAPSIIRTEIVRAYCKWCLEPGADRQTINQYVKKILAFIDEGNVRLLPIDSATLQSETSKLLLTAMQRGLKSQTWDAYYVAACYSSSELGGGALLTIDAGHARYSREA